MIPHEEGNRRKQAIWMTGIHEFEMSLVPLEGVPQVTHLCWLVLQLDVSVKVKITCLWVSSNLLTRLQQHPTLWFQLSEKIWKYSVERDGYPDYLAFKVPLWIPRVPFLRRRRLLTHAFYLCQENNEVECFSLTITFHHVSSTCPLSFWKPTESIVAPISTRSVVREAERDRKCLTSRLCCFFVL